MIPSRMKDELHRERNLENFENTIGINPSLYSIGDLVSTGTVCCVGGKVKH